jgi:shikimate kinase
VTGGGIVLRPQNVDLLKGVGTVVWLAADEATLFERAARRDHRPLLQNENPRAIFSKLFRERESLYAAAAEIRIDTSRLTHDEVAETILNKMEEFSSLRQ